MCVCALVCRSIIFFCAYHVCVTIQSTIDFTHWTSHKVTCLGQKIQRSVVFDFVAGQRQTTLWGSVYLTPKSGLVPHLIST